ncbi:hypothetical protein [Psychroserpens jangbogonensis]|uniref:hypothetical protein n=1 Tax=Psychroserpens jangbogonensis TaxID=1484460 RepID=UPI00126A0F64|nr:hypothetical protein [Psychroserpens jangbogonensis]
MSKKLNYNKTKKSTNELLNNEINDSIRLLNKIDLKNYRYLKKEIKKLKHKKGKIEKKEYLKELIDLRDRLSV